MEKLERDEKMKSRMALTHRGNEYDLTGNVFRFISRNIRGTSELIDNLIAPGFIILGGRLTAILRPPICLARYHRFTICLASPRAHPWLNHCLMSARLFPYLPAIISGSAKLSMANTWIEPLTKLFLRRLYEDLYNFWRILLEESIIKYIKRLTLD